VRKLGLGALSHIFLDLLPLAGVISDLLAPGTGGQDAAKHLDVVQGSLELQGRLLGGSPGCLSFPENGSNKGDSPEHQHGSHEPQEFEGQGEEHRGIAQGEGREQAHGSAQGHAAETQGDEPPGPAVVGDGDQAQRQQACRSLQQGGKANDEDAQVHEASKGEEDLFRLSAERRRESSFGGVRDSEKASNPCRFLLAWIFLLSRPFADTDLGSHAWIEER